MVPLAWVALAGLNAALSASKAAQAAKQRKMEADIRAAEVEAQPWTEKAPTTQISTPSPSLWAELAGAGVNTLGQAAALQQSGLFSSSTPPDVAPDMGGTSSMSPYTLMAKKAQNRSFLNPWEGMPVSSTKNVWE